MIILNDCPSQGEFVERAEHLKPSQRGRLGDVQAVEGQPGQGQGVWEHHQVIISIIINDLSLMMVLSLFWIYLRAWRRQRWQSTTRWSGRREMHLQIGISTNLMAANSSKFHSCKTHVSSFSLYFFFACRHVFPLIWRTQHDKNLSFRKQVAASHTEADKDQVVVPLTMEE